MTELSDNLKMLPFVSNELLGVTQRVEVLRDWARCEMGQNAQGVKTGLSIEEARVLRMGVVGTLNHVLIQLQQYQKLLVKHSKLDQETTKVEMLIINNTDFDGDRDVGWPGLTAALSRHFEGLNTPPDKLGSNKP